MKETKNVKANILVSVYLTEKIARRFVV